MIRPWTKYSSKKLIESINTLSRSCLHYSFQIDHVIHLTDQVMQSQQCRQQSQQTQNKHLSKTITDVNTTWANKRRRGCLEVRYTCGTSHHWRLWSRGTSATNIWTNKHHLSRHSCHVMVLDWSLVITEFLIFKPEVLSEFNIIVVRILLYSSSWVVERTQVLTSPVNKMCFSLFTKK